MTTSGMTTKNNDQTTYQAYQNMFPEIEGIAYPLKKRIIPLPVEKILLETLITQINSTTTLNVDIEDFAFLKEKNGQTYIFDIEKTNHTFAKVLAAQKEQHSPDKVTYHNSFILETNPFAPYYTISFERIKRSDARVYHKLVMVINHEPELHEGKRGLQKRDAVVFSQDANNHSRSKRIKIIEINRDYEHTNMSDIVISCKISTNKQLSTHIEILPDMPRMQTQTIINFFEKYLEASNGRTVPVYEWYSELAKRNVVRKNIARASIDALISATYDVRDDSAKIKEILTAPETAQYRQIVEGLVDRCKSIYVATATAQKINANYATVLQDKSLYIPDDEVDKQSGGSITKLDLELFRKCHIAQYEQTGNAIDLQYAKEGKVIDPEQLEDTMCFSTLFKKVDVFETQKSYWIEQYFTHTDLFRAYLRIENVDDAKEQFILKIDEFTGGIYAVELFVEGKKFEHHLELIKADHKTMIAFPKEIREEMEEGKFKSAPDFAYILNRLKNETQPH